jgi:molecular chaperone GrpE
MSMSKDEIESTNEAKPEGGAEDLEALRAKAKERDEFHNLYLHARADFDNYQKRTRREQERFREDALRDVLKDLTLVVENLDLTLAAARESGNETLTKSVSLVRDQLTKFMAQRGAEPLGTKPGEPFNPDRHEAVMVESVPGLTRDEVGLVAREGWKLGNTILRPAAVQVKKPVLSKAEGPAPSEGQPA